MFSVKICGITSSEDARCVAEAGGDAIGLNFYPRSSRYVDPESARSISSDLPSSVRAVGVFVNASARSIVKICRQVGLDCVQLHGDEPPELLAELPASMAVIRAFRIQSAELAAAAEYLDACERSGRLPDAALVDAHMEGAYGGTGTTVNWQEIAAQKHRLGQLPLILAGGLTPENVRAAIETLQPSGVDTASGVEATPGRKDRAKVRQFTREALDAFLDVRSARNR